MAVKMQVYQREEIGLPVLDREERGKGPVGRLRREQQMLPGVVYGHNQAPISFKIEVRALERALSQGGQNAVFLLEQDGKSERSVVRDIQYHKVSGAIMHVDMLRIDPTEVVRVDVPLVTVGVPVGVRIGGGGLQQTLTQLQMECLASELPSRIEIDITDLEIDQSIHVSDMLDQETRIANEGDVSIVSVLPPRVTVDEELEAEAEEAGVEPDEGTDAGEGATAAAEGGAVADGDTADGS
jgi:large subunit ribosomal protein L25